MAVTQANEIPKSFERGIHPPYRKRFSEAAPIEFFLPAGDVVISMSQHIGVPCAPTIKPRSEVEYGQRIAETDAFISAPIHASVSGKVGGPTITALPDGHRSPAVVIKPADQDQMLPEGFFEDFLHGQWGGVEPTGYEPEEIVEAIREAGIVGLGGAAFPTHVKLKRNTDRPIDTLLLNGCECEPYLTSDHRMMVETPEAIVVGMQLAAHAAGAERAIICIENNKPDAIERMREVAGDRPGVEVVVCATKYPMGGERQLIPAVLNRIVPSAPKGLPLDVGVVVVNVATAHSIARAVVHKLPLTHRVVAVTGGGISKPGNYLTPVGTLFRELIEHCGGVTGQATKVLAGGPMMGPTVPHLDIPITKGVGGITVLTETETTRHKETPCIRCGRCLDSCPLYLSPTKIAVAAKNRDYEMAHKYDLNCCIECGCCEFVCPAHIPLVQYIVAGKVQWRALQERKK